MLTIKAGSNITYDWINEQSMQKFDEMIPDKSATAGHVQNPPSSVFTGWNHFSQRGVMLLQVCRSDNMHVLQASIGEPGAHHLPH